MHGQRRRRAGGWYCRCSADLLNYGQIKCLSPLASVFKFTIQFTKCNVRVCWYVVLTGYTCKILRADLTFVYIFSNLQGS